MCEADELAQWVKAPAARPDNWSSVPRAHGRRRELAPAVSSDRHMPTMAHMHAHTTENKWNLIKDI